MSSKIFQIVSTFPPVMHIVFGTKVCHKQVSCTAHSFLSYVVSASTLGKHSNCQQSE